MQVFCEASSVNKDFFELYCILEVRHLGNLVGLVCYLNLAVMICTLPEQFRGNPALAVCLDPLI